MRTLRLSLVGTVSLALLGGLGGLALAQSDDGGSGIVTIESMVDLGSGGDAAERTYWFASDAEASDPRLSGKWTENWRCQTGTGFEMCVGTVRVENDGGTWLGRVEGFNHDAGAYDWTVLEGQGDYEGLTAIRVITATPDSEGPEGMVILDFEMPEQPEAKLPPAE